MTTFERHFNFNKSYKEDEVIQKISGAIKRSKAFAYVKPFNLLKDKVCEYDVDSDIFDEKLSAKKLKFDNEPKTVKTDICTKIIKNVEESANEKSNSSKNFFEKISKQIELIDKKKSILLSKEKQNSNEFLNLKNRFPPKNKFLSNCEKLNKIGSLKAPIYNIDSILKLLKGGCKSNFLTFFKEALKTENRFSSTDLCNIFDYIVSENKLSILPDLCDCLYQQCLYSRALSSCFIKYHNQLELYRENILNCLFNMIESRDKATFNGFIEACYCANDWNRMWCEVLRKDPAYRFEDKYFWELMTIFQNLRNNSIIINYDTTSIVIPYIMRNYSTNYELYIADIWLYSVFKTELDFKTDLKIPEQIMDQVTEKLIVIKNIPFSFLMKLISKNEKLIYNERLDVWLSQMISEKVDVKKSLCALKESLKSMNQTDTLLYNSFLLITINVIALLNKKSSYTCSKIIHDTFLQTELDKLKTLLATTHGNKFSCKWAIIECLTSSKEYDTAWHFFKEFDIIKDIEANVIDYKSVKKCSHDLLFYLLKNKHSLSIAELFERVLSIHTFNEHIVGYITNTKNCNEIFDRIVVKAFESNDKDIVKNLVLLLDHILSAEVKINFSKESLRYLIVAGVRTNIPFNELFQLINLCFKFELFENIQKDEDGFGNVVKVSSNLSYEEVIILITWLCRHIKIKMLDFTQRNEGSSVTKENLIKMCSLKIILCPSKAHGDFVEKLGSNASFPDFFSMFSQALTSPIYLSQSIKFLTLNSYEDIVNIICDSKSIYKAVYYSNI